ncbi:hypothetical protein BN2497_2793 [Janthinobacterium sp. CG23_2]|nr:hypothetical protein BN2497_2793 [Janthinobacterium sp. CG23_2]CUU27794.1 hypothetical protein BN3177_2793 [Janthinobacterium sp. CG23_2]
MDFAHSISNVENFHLNMHEKANALNQANSGFGFLYVLASGGFWSLADLKRLYLIRKLPSGQV